MRCWATSPRARCRRSPLAMDGRGFGNLVGLMLGRRQYYGPCMAFRSDLRSVLLPFPARCRGA